MTNELGKDIMPWDSVWELQNEQRRIHPAPGQIPLFELTRPLTDEELDKIKLELKQIRRRWLLGELLENFQNGITKYQPENAIPFISSEIGYPNNIHLVFVDEETGLTRTEIHFSSVGKKLGLPDELPQIKPAQLDIYDYEEIVAPSPFYPEPVNAILVTVRSWDLDSIFRRTHRIQLQQILVSFYAQWSKADGGPRELERFYSESRFKPASPREDIKSVRQSATWIEEWRSFLACEGGGMLIAVCDETTGGMLPPTNGRLTFDEWGASIEQKKTDVYDVQLGAARVISF